MYRGLEGTVWTNISHTSRSENHSRLGPYSAYNEVLRGPGWRVEYQDQRK